MEDFSRNYHRVEICSLGPDALSDEQAKKKKWETSVHEGGWKKRVNAGGCRNFLGQFAPHSQISRLYVGRGWVGGVSLLGNVRATLNVQILASVDLFCKLYVSNAPGRV